MARGNQNFLLNQGFSSRRIPFVFPSVYRVRGFRRRCVWLGVVTITGVYDGDMVGPNFSFSRFLFSVLNVCVGRARAYCTRTIRKTKLTREESFNWQRLTIMKTMMSSLSVS